MQEIKYHPLINCDSAGRIKRPLFFTKNEAEIKKSHNFYLEETFPGYYRLCTVNAILTDEKEKTYSIGCPICGIEMMPITSSRNAHRGALYICPDCNPNKKED